MAIYIFIDLVYCSVTVRSVFLSGGSGDSSNGAERIGCPLLQLPRAVWRLSHRSLDNGSVLCKAGICNKADELCLEVLASSNYKF